MTNSNGIFHPDASSATPCRIGEWTVLPDRNLLRGPSGEIRVEPRTLQVLLCLAAAAGEVVSRQELLDTIWTDTVVCENALSRTISELRRILGDQARSPRYIETIYKSGYRLLVPVETIDEGNGRHPVVGRSTSLRRHLPGLLAVMILAVAAIAIGNQAWRNRPVTRAGEAVVIAGVPLTSTPGSEYSAAISPDGSMVAFCREGDGRANDDIWVVTTNDGRPRALVDTETREHLPTWSPDGTEIAFARQRNGMQVVILPLAGGAERVVAEFDFWIWSLDWAPDGGSMAVAVAESEDTPARVVLLDLETGTRRALTTPPASTSGDRDPRWSPDGTSIAFVRGIGRGVDEIQLLTVADGAVRTISRRGRAIRGLDWMPDGRHLIVATGSRQGWSLMRLDPADGRVVMISTRDGEALAPSIAADEGSLVYEELRLDVDIMAFGIDSGQRRARLLDRPSLQSTRLDYSADVSPDGRWIAFASGRTGGRQIWLCGADAEDCRQLSHFDGLGVERVRWAPDGRRLACLSFSRTGPAIAVLDLDGVESMRFIDIPEGRFEGWSADGQWLYFSRNETVNSEIWRVGADGAAAQLVLQNALLLVGEDSDGNLYYGRPTEKGIWRHDPAASAVDTEPVFDEAIVGDMLSAALAGERLYFVCTGENGNTLVRFDPAAARSDTLYHLPPGCGFEISVHPDESEIYLHGISRSDRDLVLVTTPLQ